MVFGTISNFFGSILDPVFNPLLKLPPVLAILIIAFLITLLITVLYKYTTDQKTLKRLKDEMKDNQKKIRELSKDDPKKAMEMNQKMWSSQGTFFKQSMKPVLYTFIPLIIIFGWLNTHMAYYQIMPDQEFDITGFFAEGHAPAASLSVTPEITFLNNQTQEIIDGEAVWKLKGGSGEYVLTIDYNEEKIEKASGGKAINFIISEEREYAEPNKPIKDSKLQKVVIGNQKVYPFKDLIGWKINWLWTYIIFSFAISLGLRKVMKVY